MRLLLFSLAAFVLTFASHLVLWRIAIPRAQTTALLKVFAAGYVLALGVTLLPGAAAFGPEGWMERVHFTVFYLPMALAYASFYSLVEHDSPSLGMVAAAARSPRGCTRSDFVAELGGEALLAQRLQAASGNGLVLERDGAWALTGRGRKLAQIFEFCARLFRLERAG